MDTNEPRIPFPNGDFSKLRCAYFLCFTNRYGSNYVAQAMSSDGKLAQARGVLNYERVIEVSRELGFSSCADYFSWLVNSTKGEVFGCKASPGQLWSLYNEGFLNNFVSKPKFIHLIRRDVLSQAVSLFIASKTKRWSSNNVGIDADIEYDSGALLENIKNICLNNAMFVSMFQLLSIKPLTIYYEDFMQSPGSSILAIGDYLGVDNLKYVRSSISYRKQASEINDLLLARLKQEFMIHPQARSNAGL